MSNELEEKIKEFNRRLEEDLHRLEQEIATRSPAGRLREQIQKTGCGDYDGDSARPSS